MDIWCKEEKDDMMTLDQLIGILEDISAEGHGGKEVLTLFDGCAYSSFTRISLEADGVYIGDGYRGK